MIRIDDMRIGARVIQKLGELQFSEELSSDDLDRDTSLHDKYKFKQPSSAVLSLRQSFHSNQKP
jgi:hypothetical protein